MGRTRRDDAAYLLPAAGAAVGAGLVAGKAPLAGFAAGAFTIFVLMPWRVLFVILTYAAIANRYRLNVGTITLQPAHLILIPIALRVFVFNGRDSRSPWGWPESVIAGFIAVNVISSLLFAKSATKSVQVAGLLAMGVLAYLVTYMGASNRSKLIFAARVVLGAAFANAAIALLSYAAHAVLGTNFGVSTGGVGTKAAGLAHEYDIFGSMSGSGAIAFLVLMRERNPLFSRGFCVIAFWTCLLGLVASLTRGAWIAFAVAVIALVIVHRPASRRNRLASFGLISVAIAIGLTGVLALVSAPSDPLATSPVFIRGSELLNTETGSGQNRVSEWSLAIDDWKRSPLLGLGTNSFGQRHLAPKKRVVEGAYLGNLYIRTLYDTGIVGFILLLAFLFANLWPRRVLRISLGDLAPVAWCFTFMYLVMAIAFGVTDASFQVWPWLVLGVARASRSQATTQYHSMLQHEVPDGNGFAPRLARAGVAPRPSGGR